MDSKNEFKFYYTNKEETDKNSYLTIMMPAGRFLVKIFKNVVELLSTEVVRACYGTVLNPDEVVDSIKCVYYHKQRKNTFTVLGVTFYRQLRSKLFIPHCMVRFKESF